MRRIHRETPDPWVTWVIDQLCRCGLRPAVLARQLGVTHSAVYSWTIDGPTARLPADCKLGLMAQALSTLERQVTVEEMRAKIGEAWKARGIVKCNAGRSDHAASVTPGAA